MVSRHVGFREAKSYFAWGWRLVHPRLGRISVLFLALALPLARSVAAPGERLRSAPRCAWSWNIVPSPSPDPRGNLLTGVAAVSPSDVWAVGGSGGRYSNGLRNTLVEHWDGSSWSVVASPNPGSGLNELTGVAAGGPDDVWAVGYTSDGGDPRTLIEHWDGRRWNVVPSPNPGTGGNYLYAVAAVGADDVWAVGASGDVNSASGVTLIEHWDGTSWTVVPGSDPSGQGDLLFGVAAATSQDGMGGRLSQREHEQQPDSHRALGRDRLEHRTKPDGTTLRLTHGCRGRARRLVGGRSTHRALERDELDPRAGSPSSERHRSQGCCRRRERMGLGGG